jgi:hypothetical protein
MARYALTLFLIIFYQSYADWSFDDSSAYLSVLKIDYSDSIFEGAYLFKFENCPDCDTLPLRAQFNPPIDFGSIRFYYIPSNTLVFNADIIWAGTGSIFYPDTFRLIDEFSIDSNDVSLPSEIKYFHNCPLGSTYKISFAWNAINKFNFVHALVQRGCAIGMYLYPPAVGAFDPGRAKVIVFIFSRAQATSVCQNRTCTVKQNQLKLRLFLNKNSFLIFDDNNNTYHNLQGKKVDINRSIFSWNRGFSAGSLSLCKGDI